MTRDCSSWLWQCCGWGILCAVFVVTTAGPHAAAQSSFGELGGAERVPLPVESDGRRFDGEPDSRGDDEAEAGGVFLPSGNAIRLWEDTLATVSAGHVIAHVVPPDFAAVPPRAGVI